MVGEKVQVLKWDNNVLVKADGEGQARGERASGAFWPFDKRESAGIIMRTSQARVQVQRERARESAGVEGGAIACATITDDP